MKKRSSYTYTIREHVIQYIYGWSHAEPLCRLLHVCKTSHESFPFPIRLPLLSIIIIIIYEWPPHYHHIIYLPHIQAMLPLSHTPLHMHTIVIKLDLSCKINVHQLQSLLLTCRKTPDWNFRTTLYTVNNNKHNVIPSGYRIHVYSANFWRYTYISWNSL